MKKGTKVKVKTDNLFDGMEGIVQGMKRGKVKVKFPQFQNFYIFKLNDVEEI